MTTDFCNQGGVSIFQHMCKHFANNESNAVKLAGFNGIFVFNMRKENVVVFSYIARHGNLNKENNDSKMWTEIQF